jgi:hypothetical protein
MLLDNWNGGSKSLPVDLALAMRGAGAALMMR